MADFKIKKNDTFPYPQATLSDTVGAINLTTATSVKFIMSNGTTVVSGVAGFVDRANGVVNYVWVTGDTGIVGTYAVEWEITWAGGKIETVPNDPALNEKVVIGADLG